MKDKDESRRVARLIGAESKQCWRNAALAAVATGSSYVEGMAVLKRFNLPIEHGWIEQGSTIIDPTLPDDDLEYFAGFVLPSDGIRAGIAYPIGFASEGMNNARKLAFQFIGISWK